MNPNPAVANDLQQAINDITNSSNLDPVFADPVAAPAAETVVAAETVAPEPVLPEMPDLGAMPPADLAAPDLGAPAITAPETLATADDLADTAPAMTETFVAETVAPAGDMRSIKEAALRDLAPLLEKMDVAPEQKFSLYKNMIEDLDDTSVVSSAYQTATGIADDKARGEALLYLVETIDKKM